MCADQVENDYKNAVSNALRRSAPLSFSPDLGRTIAGVPLILIFDKRGLVTARERFIGLHYSRAVAVSSNSSISTCSAATAAIDAPGATDLGPGSSHSNAKPAAGAGASQDRRTRCLFQSGLYGVPITSFFRSTWAFAHSNGLGFGWGSIASLTIRAIP
jgi:hypothetical protein